MGPQEQEVARRAAARLAEVVAPSLPGEVELELLRWTGDPRADASDRPTTYDGGLTIGIALDALIIQASQFAYQVISDRRGAQRNLDEDELRRLVRQEIDNARTISREQKEQIAGAVTEEAIVIVE